MHSSLLVLALGAIGAIAAPLEKRDYEYQTQYYTKVVYVTKTYGGEDSYQTHIPHHHHKQPNTQPAYTPPAYTTAAPQPTGGNGGGYGGGSGNAPNGYAAMVLKQHNLHRANHSAPDIEWDQGLADTAQKIGETCSYAHNTEMDGGGYGQNIAAGISAANVDQVITNMFYNGEVGNYASYYGDANPPWTEGTGVWGHFSQVVWKGTKKVGCATVTCNNGLTSPDDPNMASSYSSNPYFTVCNYQEAGNMAGAYAQNVGEPLGHPSVIIPS